MHYLVYQLTNTVNGKVYIGVHQTTNPDDGYMGSGTVLKRAITKHGTTAFKKDILFDFSTPDEMFAKERELVTEDFINRPDTYNLRIGGEGGWDYVNASGKNHNNVTGIGAKAGGIALRKKLLEDPTRKKRHYTDRANNFRSWYLFNNHPFLGKHHTAETIAKQKLAAIGRSVGKTNPLYGKKWMTDGTTSKPATTEEQQLLLTSGWRYGRIIKKS